MKSALLSLVLISAAHGMKLPTRLRGGSVVAKNDPGEKRPVFPAAKDAFNNVRVPAALLSGTSFVAVNTAPLPVAADTVLIGVAKRVYLTVAVGTFASALVSVLIATIALEKLGGSVEGGDDLELEYVACQTHFFASVLGACLIVGLRSWISFTCPRFANTALSMVLSSFLLMLHFLPSKLFAVPLRYAQLLIGRMSLSSPVLILALAYGAYATYLFTNGCYLGLISKACWNLR